jgi:hypothetical protein
MVSVKWSYRRTSSVLAASAVVAAAATSLTLVSASLANASPGSYEVIACKSVPGGSLHGTLRIHNQDTTTPHSYTATIGWNKGSETLGSTEVRTGMIQPGQSQDIDASTGASATAGEIPTESISCAVNSILDENGESVES